MVTVPASASMVIVAPSGMMSVASATDDDARHAQLA